MSYACLLVLQASVLIEYPCFLCDFLRYNITTSTNITIINNIPPIVPPTAPPMAAPGGVDLLLPGENRRIMEIVYDLLAPIVTQVKLPPVLLQFTEVPSSFTSSHTCSPLPLALKPLEQFCEQLEP